MSSEICQVKDENGDICGESVDTTLEILQEVKHVYEARLKRIDQEACGDGTQLKLRTLSLWIADLEEQNASLVRVVEQLEREAEGRTNAVSFSSLQNPDSRDVDEKLRELKRTISELRADKEKLKEIIDDNDRSIRELTNRNQDCETKLEALKNSLNCKDVSDEKSKSSEDMDATITELENFKKKLQDCCLEKEELQNKLEGASKQIKSLECEIKQLRDEKCELMKPIIDKIKIEGDNSDTEFYSQCECDSVGERRNKRAQQSEEIRKIKCSYERVVKRNKVLEMELLNLKQKLEDYKQHTDESAKRTAATRVELDNCVDTFECLEDQVGTLKTILKQKAETLCSFQANYNKLQNELVTMKQAYADLEDNAKHEIKELQRELGCFSQTMQDCQCKNQSLAKDDNKHQRMLLEAANREIKLKKKYAEREKQLQEKLQCEQEENCTLSNTVNILDEELQRLKCELEEREAQLLGVGGQNQCVIKTCEKLQKENSCLQRELCHLRNAKSLYDKEQMVLKQRVSVLESQKESLDRELGCMEESLRGLTEFCNIRSNSVQNLQNQLSEVTVCHDEFRRLSSMNIERVRAWIKEMCNSHENLKKAVDRWEEIKNKLKRNYSSEVDRSKCLEKELDGLQDTLCDYRKQIEKNELLTEKMKRNMCTIVQQKKTLQKEILNLQTSLKNLKEKNCSLAEQNKGLEMELNGHRQSLKDYKQQLQKSEEIIEEMKRKNCSQVEKNKCLEKEIKMLKQSLHEYEQQTDESTRNISASQGTVEFCKATLSTMEEKVKFLKKMLCSKTQQLNKVYADNEAMQNELNAQKHQLKALGKENECCKGDLVRSEKQTEIFQAEIQKCKSIIEATEEKVAHLKAKLKLKCEHLAEVKKDLEREKDKNNDDTLERRNKMLEEEIRDYKDELGKSELRTMTFENELKSCKCLFETTQGEVEHLQQKLKEKCECSEKIAEALEEEYKNKNKLEEDMEKIRKELENYKNQVVEAEGQAKDYQTELHICKKKFTSIQEKFACLKETLKVKCNEFSQMQNEKEKTKKELHETCKKLHEREGHIQDLKIQVARLKEQLQSIHAEHAESDALQNEVTKLKAEIRHLNKIQEKSASENESLREELHRLKEAYAQSGTEESKLCKKLSELEKQKNLMEKENACLCGHLQKLTESYNMSEMEESKLKTMITYLQNQINCLENENCCLRSELQELRESKTWIHHEDSRLQQEINSLRRKLMCIRQSLQELEDLSSAKKDSTRNDFKQTCATCQDEVCSRSTNTIEKSCMWIKDLCRTNQKLSQDIKERDLIIQELMNKEKIQEDELRKVRRKLGMLWIAFKSSKKTEDKLLKKLCPSAAIDKPVDQACCLEDCWEES